MTIQVALSLVLLVGAGLFVRTLRNLQNVDIGFNREHLLLFELNATANGTPAPKALEVYQRATERLGHVPGVKRVGFSRIPLLAGGSWSTSVNIPGYVSANSRPDSVRANGIDPDFFATIELPLL